MLRRAFIFVLVSGMLPLFGLAMNARAASEFEIRGQLIGSDTIPLSNVHFSLCSTTAGCLVPNVAADGSFVVTLTPDQWRINLVRWGGEGNWSLTSTQELTASAEWQLTLPELVRVDVTALDWDGTPVIGAYVTARFIYGGGLTPANDVELSTDLPAFAGTSGVSGQTDSAGQSSFWSLPDDNLDLSVWVHEGTLFHALPLETPTKTSVVASADTAVTARALPRRTLALRVQDYAGRPVSARISVRSQWAQTHDLKTVDGRTSFQFLDGEASIWIDSGDQVWSLPSRWSVNQQLMVTKDDVLTLTLPEPVRLRGTVTDANTSDVAENVRVWVRGPSEDADLGAGLAPAHVYSGTLGAISNPDGSVQFRAFPSEALTTEARLQGWGAYRTTAPEEFEATADTSFEVTLPESATITVDTRSAANELLPSGSSLRTGRYQTAQFARDASGRPVIAVTPGTFTVQSYLDITGAGIQVSRDVEVNSDTVLEFRLPAMPLLSMLALDADGAPVPNMRFTVSGNTVVGTDSGPLKGWFRSSLAADARGMATLPVPPTFNAEVRGGDGTAAVWRLPVQQDRSVVVQSPVELEGVGVPYTWFQAAKARTTSGWGTFAWQPVDATTVTLDRLVQDPFGQEATNLIWTGSALNAPIPVEVRYAPEGTTCVRGVASRIDLSGPPSAFVCRTRPVDDSSFTPQGSWARVKTSNAYGGSYRVTDRQGSSLALPGLRIPSGNRPGEVSLLAFTGPNAGTVRLRLGDEWISRSFSLQGPIASAPTWVRVPIYEQERSLRGRLELVVKSDDLKVRVDGLVLPVPTAPSPLLAPIGRQ